VMLFDDTSNNIDRALPQSYFVSNVTLGKGYRSRNLFEGQIAQ
jgi:hypothetical protein